MTIRDWLLTVMGFVLSFLPFLVLLLLMQLVLLVLIFLGFDGQLRCANEIQQITKHLNFLQCLFGFLFFRSLKLKLTVIHWRLSFHTIFPDITACCMELESIFTCILI